MIIDEQQYEGLQIDYELMERIIKQKTLNNPLKYKIVLLSFMIITTILSLIVGYTLNYE